MKRYSQSNVILLTKVVLLPLLCVALLYLKDHFWGFQFVLTFGLIIIPLNIDKLKHGLFQSVLRSVLLCFVVFFLSFALAGSIKYLFFMEGDINKTVEGSVFGFDINMLLFLFPVAMLSPLFMFWGYRMLFHMEITAFTRVVKWVSVAVLVLFAFTASRFGNDAMFFVWQVVMALALQLMLYQNEIKSLLRPKSNI